MTMTTVEVLRAARAKIENPDNWGRGRPGNVLSGLCAHLAIYEAAHLRGPEILAIQAFARTIGHDPRPDTLVPSYEAVWDFNDHHTHAEVLAAFDRAIANEEAREAEFTGGEMTEPAAETPVAVLV